MSTGWFGPCPHCNGALSYLHAVAGSSMTPQCPYCREVVPVTRSTFLMADHSSPAPTKTEAPKPR